MIDDELSPTNVTKELRPSEVATHVMGLVALGNSPNWTWIRITKLLENWR